MHQLTDHCIFLQSSVLSLNLSASLFPRPLAAARPQTACTLCRPPQFLLRGARRCSAEALFPCRCCAATLRRNPSSSHKTERPKGSSDRLLSGRIFSHVHVLQLVKQTNLSINPRPWSSCPDAPTLSTWSALLPLLKYYLLKSVSVQVTPPLGTNQSLHLLQGQNDTPLRPREPLWRFLHQVPCCTACCNSLLASSLRRQIFTFSYRAKDWHPGKNPKRCVLSPQDTAAYRSNLPLLLGDCANWDWSKSCSKLQRTYAL